MLRWNFCYKTRKKYKSTFITSAVLSSCVLTAAGTMFASRTSPFSRRVTHSASFCPRHPPFCTAFSVFTWYVTLLSSLWVGGGLFRLTVLDMNLKGKSHLWISPWNHSWENSEVWRRWGGICSLLLKSSHASVAGPLMPAAVTFYCNCESLCKCIGIGSSWCGF